MVISGISNKKLNLLFFLFVILFIVFIGSLEDCLGELCLKVGYVSVNFFILVNWLVGIFFFYENWLLCDNLFGVDIVC